MKLLKHTGKRKLTRVLLFVMAVFKTSVTKHDQLNSVLPLFNRQPSFQRPPNENRSVIC